MNWRLGTSLAILASLGSTAGTAQPRPDDAKLPGKKISEKDGAEMVLVPAGSYPSGIAQKEMKKLVRSTGDKKVESFYLTELPESTRDLPAFYIDRDEVTNERYERYMKATGHKAPTYWRSAAFARAKQPVVGVGWAEAKSYCEWAGKDLPTEFEWEKAARGADKQARKRVWPWGSEAIDRNYNGRGAGKRAPVEVGSFEAGNSPYGARDMAGNVWEMTSSPWPKEGATAHTIKGGSFLNSLASVRVTVRWAAEDENQGASWLGFRCVLRTP